MKSKHYWEDGEATDSPFALPKRVARGIESCREAAEVAEAQPPAVKYLWAFLTDDGLGRGGAEDGHEDLGLEGWLNVVDESAGFGAECMVVYAGASPSVVPYIWDVCAWAQDVHGMQVGLHVRGSCLSEEDVEGIGRLIAEKTFVITDAGDVDALQFLEEGGIRVRAANVTGADRPMPCEQQDGMACVGPDGGLFSCGLALGDSRFALGACQGSSFREVMAERELPGSAGETHSDFVTSCDGCPPMMAERVSKRRSE